MELGYDTCAICGRNELIKYKTKYGRLVCIHCAERPSDPIMERLNL